MYCNNYFRVKEALIKQNRRLPSGRPETKYNELLQNKFKHIVGTPKWAKLNRERNEDSDDSDDELLKVCLKKYKAYIIIT
jgi:U3 small nucleolar RNA-associated protein 18